MNSDKQIEFHVISRGSAMIVSTLHTVSIPANSRIKQSN